MPLANVADVEKKLNELIARLHTSDDDVKASLRDSLPEPRILALHLPDLEARYWAELIDGHLGDLQPGEPPEAHMQIRAESDDLIRLIDGDLHLVSAYLSGRIRVTASFEDMLSLRRMMP
jgi:hypothetical protein